MKGYFKVHRKILGSQVFAHQTALKIWIWCLSKVTYKDRYISMKSGKGFITVKLAPGQFVFGRFTAEEELNIDGSTIYKWMQKFASSEFEMINIESNNQYSVVTICKWDEYQNGDEEEVTTEEQPSSSQVAAKEQPSNTNNKVKKVYKVNNIISEQDFYQLVYECDPLKYSQDLCAKFISYWTEKNKSGKMRFETEKFFEIPKRLATWKRNEENFKSKANGINSGSHRGDGERTNEYWSRQV